MHWQKAQVDEHAAKERAAASKDYWGEGDEDGEGEGILPLEDTAGGDVANVIRSGSLCGDHDDTSGDGTC